MSPVSAKRLIPLAPGRSSSRGAAGSAPAALSAVGCALVASLLSACGGDGAGGEGGVSVILESEDVIANGIAAGDAGAAMRDGWSAQFSKYLATVGGIDLHLATNEGERAQALESFTVDMTAVPLGSGLPLWSLGGLGAGRWILGFATPGAAHGATRHSSVSEADHDTMVREDWTYLIEGELSAEAGQSCPPVALVMPGARTANGNVLDGNPCYDAPAVSFRFGLRAETRFTECQVDDLPGFAVVDGRVTTVAVTLHGDHLFFNGFPEGDESGIARRAQFLANSDLDLDGAVTTEELDAITLTDLPELLGPNYQLGGAPVEVTPTSSVAEYLAVQLKTQGHFQGEGECLIDGTAEHE